MQHEQGLGMSARATELAAQAGEMQIRAPETLVLSCDLRAHGFINIDFRDSDQSAIPLHLSLRRDAGQIVANRWSPKGWRREVIISAPLRPQLHVIQLCFQQAAGLGMRVTLRLDGVKLAMFDGWPRPDRTSRVKLRRGFPGLSQIGWMTWPAGLRSVHRLASVPSATMVLTPRLELMVQTTCAAPVLELDDDSERWPLLPLDRTPDAGMPAPMAVLLPGRVWSNRSAAAITLRALDAAGAELARRELHRSDILAMLQSPAADWIARHDVVARLQMLEHVHFAGFWSELSSNLRSCLDQEARRHHKAVFAPPPGMVTQPSAVSAPNRPALACDAFHHAVAQHDPRSATVLFEAMVAKFGLAGPEVRQFAFLLSEWFCLNADPRDLAKLCEDAAAAPHPDNAQIWSQTAALPLLWAVGDWTACLAILHQLPRMSGDWMVTPALGWCARAIASDMPDLAGQRPRLSERIDLCLALLEAVASKSDAHFSQCSCTFLIEGVLDLLEASSHFPDRAQWRSEDLALLAYALCPDFWSAYDGRDPLRRPAQFRTWRTAFARLQTACLCGDWQALAQAARPFLARPIAGGATLRRFALAERNLPCDASGLPDMEALTGQAEQDQINEAALRWLAFPRSDARRAALALECRSPVHRAACEGLRVAAPEIARPSAARAQKSLSRAHARLHRWLGTGAPVDTAQVDDVISRAQALSGVKGGAVGVPVLLALTEALVRADLRGLAQRVLQGCARPLRDRALCAQPAVALALARFSALCPDLVLRAELQSLCAAYPVLAPPRTQDPQAIALRAASDPLADTAVVLISCHAYLRTRVPAIMEAWGDRLAQMGIPVIIVVGRAPDQQAGCATCFDGRVLQLDVADDYESLPQKMLALIEWMLTRTGFGRMFKIDDDCFLDPEAFFGDLAFLNTPYFGRPLQRAIGDMDRGWHMAQARSARGRAELDKSPEPARYADGATGYILTRQAMAAVCDARATPQGRALEQMSFMEDKLIGDLLALTGQSVAGPNYDLAVFRKSVPELPPVSQYHAGFMPFAGSGIKLVHLDKGSAPGIARAAQSSPWPRPMKVWPVSRPARLGWASQGLDLISAPERLAQCEAAAVTVVAVMRNEHVMLEHFLSHYRRLGVGGFLIVDNGSEDGTLQHLAAQSDVAVFSTDTPYSQSAYGVLWQEALLAQFRLGKWSLVADADELAFWSLPDAHGRVHGDLPELLRGSEFAEAEAVRLRMFDLYPARPLAETRFEAPPFLEANHVDREPFRNDWQGRGPWSNCATITSALRHRLMAEAGQPARAHLFVAQKYALLRYHPFMRLSAGLHYISGARVAQRELGFAHFKYHAGFHAKAQAEVARGEHFNKAEEYRKYLALQETGGVRLFCPDISVRLSECPDLRAICMPQVVSASGSEAGAHALAAGA
ncbi:MAG: hypothetical protein EA339_04020 [Rhodobacteraceae bacterium]|nr:MAG: hypothetical protein EA339_04020 [Paracoccaceae bacterium]